MAEVIKTSCGVCGCCCEIDAYVEDGKLISVEGARNAPGQRGSQCSKGAAVRQFVYNKERVLYPMKQVGKKGEGTFERVSWDEALDLIAEKLLKVRADYGARSTVFYAGYPKWFRPALLRLANAYGSPNFCTESSTCFQAVDLAWRTLYGGHVCMPDFANTRTLLVWSSNLYHTNIGMIGMYQGLKERGAKIIVVDPRNTVTAHDADIHLRPTPGTDGALALAMAQVILSEGLYDKAFVDAYVYGFEQYRAYAERFTPERAQEITGVPAEQIRLAARTYAGNGPASILFTASPMVHHINGVQNYRAIFSLCAITGNYDVEGGNRRNAGPATPLNEFKKIRRYDGEEAIGQWEYPAWYDLSCDEAQGTRLADYILEGKPYPIKAVFGMGFNHRMWPKPSRMLVALGKLDFFVNTELFFTDACRMADLVLPACTTLEREEVRSVKGGRVFFSNRAIEPLGEAKNDIEIIMEVHRRMGLGDEVLNGGYEAYMRHILEPSGLTLEELKAHPEGMRGKRLIPPGVRYYEKHPLDTPTGKVELDSVVLGAYSVSHGYSGLPEYRDYREIAGVDRESYPLILATGCRKPQFFHSRLYRVPWLSQLEKTPLVEMHPADMGRFHIADGAEVTVTTPAGTMDGIASGNVSGLPGVVYIYHGNPKGDANELIPPDYLDPISGFPGFKSYFCRVESR